MLTAVMYICYIASLFQAVHEEMPQRAELTRHINALERRHIWMYLLKY